MACCEAELINNGDSASPYFTPFLIGNMLDKFLSAPTLLYVSVTFLLAFPVSWGYQTK